MLGKKIVKETYFLDFLYVLAVYPIIYDGSIGHGLESSLSNFAGRRQEKSLKSRGIQSKGKYYTVP